MGAALAGRPLALFGWESAESFEMGPMGNSWMFRRDGGDRIAVLVNPQGAVFAVHSGAAKAARRVRQRK